PYGDPLMALEDPSHLPQHGDLKLFPDGSFNYTPDPGFTGTDTFGYYVSDGYRLRVDPTNLSVPIPRSVIIPLAAGLRPANTPAPVLFDDSYPVLKLENPGISGEFLAKLTANDTHLTFPSASDYPLDTVQIQRSLGDDSFYEYLYINNNKQIAPKT